MTITLYRVDSGFSNVCDGITVRRPGSDVIYTEDIYDLPDGYTIDVDEYGTERILDADGHEATPCIRSNRPGAAVFLVPHDGGMIPIKKAKALGKRIPLRDSRISAGMTQQQLAKLSGVNIRQIQRVELGEAEACNLTAKNLLAIADALGVDPRELIEDDEG